MIIADGWAKSDVEYVWKENPVQLAGNLSLPGGFKLGAFGSEYCVMMYEGATCRLLSCSMSTCSL